jgi:hypothetical protein
MRSSWTEDLRVADAGAPPPAQELGGAVSMNRARRTRDYFAFIKNQDLESKGD